MFWRKLFDRNPKFSVFCDKLAAKSYIRERLPNLPVVETLRVVDGSQEWPSDPFDCAVAIKANHGSGFNIFLNSGQSLRKSQKYQLDLWLKKPFGKFLLEWGYQKVERKIFAEALVCDPCGKPLIDLSVHAVSEKPILIEIIAGMRTKEKRKAYFTVEGVRCTELEKDSPDWALPLDFEIPESYVKALNFTKCLSKSIDYARYDFFCNGQQLLAGEITVYPGSGLSNQDAFKNYHAHLEKHWSIQGSWFFKADLKGWKRIYRNILCQQLCK